MTEKEFGEYLDVKLEETWIDIEISLIEKYETIAHKFFECTKEFKTKIIQDVNDPTLPALATLIDRLQFDLDRCYTKIKLAEERDKKCLV